VIVAVAAAVVVMLGTTLAATLQDDVRAPDGGAVALVAVAALALAWRRTAPLVVLAVVIAAVVAARRYPYGPVKLCMVFAMFEAARLRPLRTSQLACGAAVTTATATLLIRAGQDAAHPLPGHRSSRPCRHTRRRRRGAFLEAFFVGSTPPPHTRTERWRPDRGCR
jgi:hypothetical protein